ncbi:hypothetical protein B9J99_11795 [Staphylococcus capitis]|nr:hypothetical protein [Staphylococcus epidermidis]PAK56052.1 hypothetical protein B9J99_11795 [Staphylococcus capitis]
MLFLDGSVAKSER